MFSGICCIESFISSILLLSTYSVVGQGVGQSQGPRQDGKCYTSVDLVLALDASGSVKLPNWVKEVEYAKQLIGNFHVSENGTHVGLIDFSKVAKVRVHLNGHTGRQLEAINKILEDLKGDYQDDVTYTDLALMAAVRMFKKVPTSRNAAKMLIVITDGQTTKRGKKSGMALMQGPVNNLQALSVTTYSVAVGEKVKGDELLLMANSNPNHVLRLENFDGLFGSISKLTEISCPDIDECANGFYKSKCHAEADCKNTKLSFYCVCKPGFSGNGLQCNKDNKETEENIVNIVCSVIAVFVVITSLVFGILWWKKKHDKNSNKSARQFASYDTGAEIYEPPKGFTNKAFK